MSLPLKDKEEILNGSFVLDCPILELTPTLPTSERTTYKGAGSVVLKSEGYFEIKLFATQDVPLNEAFAWHPLGKIIHESHHYNLIATDMGGRVWHAGP